MQFLFPRSNCGLFQDLMVSMHVDDIVAYMTITKTDGGNLLDTISDGEGTHLMRMDNPALMDAFDINASSYYTMMVRFHLVVMVVMVVALNQWLHLKICNILMEP